MSFFKSETTLPILVTVMCGLIAVVTILYGYNTGKFTWLSDKTQKQNIVQEEKKEEEKITRTDYTEVARKTLDWIDKQRNEEGWYILARACGQKDCELIWDDDKVGNKDGLIATWVRLNFYEQHQDPKDLEIVKKDIDVFYDKYKDKDLSDSLWLCKITYEMAQSKYIDQGQKDKLKELCIQKEVVSFDSVDLKKEKEKLAETLNTKAIFGYFNVMLQGLHDSFGGVTDLVYQYRFSDNGNYLKTAKESMEKVKDIINSEESSLSNKCLLGLGGLDLYSITKIQGDFNLVKNIYEQIKNDGKSHLDPFCGLLGKKLYNIDMKNEYLKTLETNNKKLVEEYFKEEEGYFRLGVAANPFRGVVKNSLLVELIR